MNARVASKMRAKRVPPTVAAPSPSKTPIEPADDASQQVSQPTASNQPTLIVQVPCESARDEVTPTSEFVPEIEVAEATVPDVGASTPAPDVAEGSRRKRKHKHWSKDKSSSRSGKRSRKSKDRREEKGKDKVAEQAEEEENLNIIRELTNWWKEAHEQLRTSSCKSATLEGERRVPNWSISENSSIFQTHVGQDS